VPSWYLLLEQDRMINPKTQEFMTSRMKAGVERMDVDHTPIAMAPEKAVGVLRTALTAVSRSEPQGRLMSSRAIAVSARHPVSVREEYEGHLLISLSTGATGRYRSG